MCPKRIYANKFEDLKKENDELKKKVSLFEEEKMKRTKEYEKFKEIQRSENEQMEYRQQNVFRLNTKVMSLESELKIANRKLKTEARNMEKLQSELDSCKEEKTFEAKKATNLIDEMKKQISTLKGS